MNRKETRTQRKGAEGRREKRKETHKPRKRATAQVLPYYSTSTLISGQRKVAPERKRSAPRRWRMPPWDRLPPQNFGICPLDAARDHTVPPANFSGRLQTESTSATKGKLLREAYGFFGPIAVPLERERAKVKRVQTSTVL